MSAQEKGIKQDNLVYASKDIDFHHHTHRNQDDISNLVVIASKLASPCQPSFGLQLFLFIHISVDLVLACLLKSRGF